MKDFKPSPMNHGKGSVVGQLVPVEYNRLTVSETVSIDAPHSSSSSRTGPSQSVGCLQILLHFPYPCLEHVVYPASPFLGIEVYPISG